MREFQPRQWQDMKLSRSNRKSKGCWAKRCQAAHDEMWAMRNLAVKAITRRNQAQSILDSTLKSGCTDDSLLKELRQQLEAITIVANEVRLECRRAEKAYSHLSMLADLERKGVTPSDDLVTAFSHEDGLTPEEAGALRGYLEKMVQLAHLRSRTFEKADQDAIQAIDGQLSILRPMYSELADKRRLWLETAKDEEARMLDKLLKLPDND